MEFSKTIHLIRVMLGWKQKHMAAALNVSVQSVSAWESGKRKSHPAIPRLLKILAERNGIIFNPRGYPEFKENENGKGQTL